MKTHFYYLGKGFTKTAMLKKESLTSPSVTKEKNSSTKVKAMILEGDGRISAIKQNVDK